MIWPISFSNFSEVLTGFTCARPISNFQSICLILNILRSKRSENLRSKTPQSDTLDTPERGLAYLNYLYFDLFVMDISTIGNLKNHFSTFIKGIYTFSSICF